jgi:hypothetical protein
MTRTGRSIPEATPLVSDTPRAAALLGLEVGDLEAAVAQAQLPVWGTTASGAVVYRWPALLEAAVAAGLPVPERREHTWRRRPAVVPTEQ